MRAMGIAATAVLLVTTAAGPEAQAQSRQAFGGTFTTQEPSASSGYRLSIDYVDPQRPDGKPYAVERIVQRLHPGTQIDTSVPPRCAASDQQLVSQGEGACPPASRVGGGRLDADTGMAAGPVPRVIESRVVFFNAEDELILFTESKNAGDPPIRTSGRVQVGLGTLTSMVPPVPGSPPPDPFLALKRVRVALDPVTRVVDGRSRAFITTPAVCPPARRWLTEASFTYRDGVTQTAASPPSACRRADRWRPRVRVRGVPRRRCVRRAFAARVLAVDHGGLRSVGVRLDRRLLRRGTAKRQRVRVSLRRLRPGSHRLTVTAVDQAGNRGRRVVRFRSCSR